MAKKWRESRESRDGRLANLKLAAITPNYGEHPVHLLEPASTFNFLISAQYQIVWANARARALCDNQQPFQPVPEHPTSPGKHHWNFSNERMWLRELESVHIFFYLDDDVH